MKEFIAFVTKEFRHIFRDRRTLLILFGMPVAQVALFGFALNNEIKNANVGILDPSNDLVTTSITNKINASGYFNTSVNIKSEKDISEAFKKGSIKMCIVYSPLFAGKMFRGEVPDINIITDATDPNQASTLSSYAVAIINSYQKEINPGGRDFLVVPESRMLYNPGLKAVYMFVPGVMAMILMLVSAMMTSITIAKEKELGTMELLLVSPLKPIHIVLGKVAPYWFLSLIICSIVILMGVFIFGMPVNGSIALLAFCCMLFVFTALALGIIISEKAGSQMAAMMASLMGLLLPTMLLSGFIFPIENMPVILRIISNLIPAKWFIIIIKGIMIKGVGIDVLWKPIGILTLITGSFLFIGFKSLKPRIN